MSKGPFIARIDKVVKGKNCVTACVTSLANGRQSEIKLPDTVDLSQLVPDVIIGYYLEENVSSSENFSPKQREETLPVLVFLSDDEGMPLEKGLILLKEGNRVLTLQKLPHIVDALLDVSPYYRTREVLVAKALNVLDITQDADTLDALFSMKVENLYALLGNILAPLPQTKAAPPSLELQSFVVKNIFIPVQIADCLLSMASNGANLENPSECDLRDILRLASVHGENQETIDNFIARYAG